jgi:hypothetical protein
VLRADPLSSSLDELTELSELVNVGAVADPVAALVDGQDGNAARTAEVWRLDRTATGIEREVSQHDRAGPVPKRRDQKLGGRSGRGPAGALGLDLAETGIELMQPGHGVGVSLIAVPGHA